MKHRMSLQPRYFDFIERGSKRVELRLYDEKRRRIEIGDQIIFTNDGDASRTLTARVVGLLRYASFAELFEDFDIAVLADPSMTKPELLAVLEGFYPLEQQQKYGVLGIRLALEA